MAANKGKKARKALPVRNQSSQRLKTKRPKMAIAQAGGRVQTHTSMVMDPCNSVLGKTAYRGSDGFVSRFARTQSVATGVNTAFLHIFYPAYNSIFFATYADGAAAVPTVTYNVAGPGQAFLLANADVQRAVGACTEITYTGTELNRQGTLFMGSVKATVFNKPITLDTLAPLLGHTTRTPDNTLSAKWIPSSVEEEYWGTGVGAPEASSDRNVLVIMGTGFTGASPFTFTNTLIAEWQPEIGLGLAANNPNTADAPAGLEHVRSNLARAGNWWLSAAHSLETGYQTAKGVYNATRGVRAGLMALTM